MRLNYTIDADSVILESQMTQVPIDPLLSECINQG
jgi:hypothetical protein